MPQFNTTRRLNRPNRVHVLKLAIMLIACVALIGLGAGCSAKSKADKLQEQGVLWFKNGKYYKAIERFEEVLKETPDRTDTLVLLAECYLNTSKPELAIETAEKVLAKEPNNIEAQLTAGQGHLTLASNRAKPGPNGEPELEPEHLAKAQEITKKLTDAAPDAAAGLILQGKIDSLSGRQMTAEREFRRAREIEPGNLTATLGLIDSLLGQKKMSEAEQIAREELAKQPADEPNTLLVIALARTLGAQQRFDEAIALLEPGIADGNETPDFMHHLLAGQLMLSQIANLEQALVKGGDVASTTTAAMTQNVGTSDSTPMAGQLVTRKQAAIQQLANLGSRMKGRYPDRPESFFFRGISYQFMGNLEEATRHFDQAVSLAPSSRQYRLAQGMVLLERKEYTLARQAFRNILQVYPNDFEARTRIAQCLMLEGSYDEAASMLASLNLEQPQNTMLTQMRGRALLMSDNPELVEQGLALLTKTADVAGNVAGSEEFAKGLTALKEADALVKQNNKDDANAKLASAEGFFRESLKAQPDNFIAAVQLAQLAERRGDRFEALRYLKMATTKEPALLDKQASLYARLGQPENALKVYRQIQERQPSMQNELKIADLYTEGLRNEEAGKLIDELIERYPNEAEPVLRKGVLIGRVQSIEAGYEYLKPMLDKYPESIALRVASGRLLFLSNRAPEAIVLLKGTIDKAHAAAAANSDPAVMQRVDRALLPLYQELIIANLLAGQSAAALEYAQTAINVSNANASEFLLLQSVAQIQSGAYDQALVTLGTIANEGEPAPGQTLIQTLARAANGDQAGALTELGAAKRIGDASEELYRILLEKTPLEKLREIAPGLALQIYLSSRPLYAPASLKLAEESLAKLPEDAFLLTRKADTEQLAGKRREAYETLLALQKLRPDSAAVLLAQADVQAGIAREMRGRGDKAGADQAMTTAEEAIRAALKIEPENKVAQQKLSLFLQGQGRIDEANQFYADLIKIDPDNGVAYNNLAWNMAEAGKLDEAIKWGNEALRVAPQDGGVLDTVGFIEFKRGENERALELLGKAVRALPSVPTVRLHHAMALEKAGRADEAVRELEVILVAAPGSQDAEQAREMLKRLAPDSTLLQEQAG